MDNMKQLTKYIKKKRERERVRNIIIFNVKQKEIINTIKESNKQNINSLNH